MNFFTAIGNFLENSISFFGLADCVIIGLTTLYTARGYSGKSQEKFSTFNHFISELGEVGVSARAGVFNLGLIAGGLVLIPFFIGLGLRLNDVWAWLGIVSGLWTALSIFFVGVYSMDNLPPHIKAANSYFCSGLVTVVMFSLAILFQTTHPASIDRWAVLFCLPAAAAYGASLILVIKVKQASGSSSRLDPQAVPDRPRIWALPIVEWSVYFATFLWFFGIAIIEMV
jgi:hypothetical protein